MRRVLAVTTFGLLSVVMSACGGTNLDDLMLHPLAGTRVVSGETASQNALSSESSFDGRTTTSHHVTNVYQHDDTPVQRDGIVDSLIAHAESAGCEVVPDSSDAGSEPYIRYAVNCPGFDDATAEISVSKREVTIELRAGDPSPFVN